MSAGDLRRETDLCAWSGNVDSCPQLVSNAPYPRGNLMPEDHTRGHPVRLLSRRDAQIGATQGCCFNGEKNVSRTERWDRTFLESECARGTKRRCEHEIHGPSIRFVTINVALFDTHAYACMQGASNTVEHLFDMMGV